MRDKITLYGIEYNEITDDKGNTKLERHDSKNNMIIELCFSNAKDDTETLKDISKAVKNALIGTIHS